jgi:DNA invertase Pin-like site-specific DNA recombinase
MRIAGYVRQTPGLKDPDTAFAQSERVRRWVRDTGNELIAVCQDHHASVEPSDRPGFKALLDIVRNDDADAVLIASLAALSPDKIQQEIMISDLRSAGATVIATDERDLETLKSAADDHTRIVVRDVVAKLGEYRDAFGLSSECEPTVGPAEATDPQDPRERRAVVVELIVPTGSD